MNEPSFYFGLKWYAAWHQQPKCIWKCWIGHRSNWSALSMRIECNKITCTCLFNAHTHSHTHSLLLFRSSVRLQFWADLNILLHLLQAPFNSCIQKKEAFYASLIETFTFTFFSSNIKLKSFNWIYACLHIIILWINWKFKKQMEWIDIILLI